MGNAGNARNVHKDSGESLRGFRECSHFTIPGMLKKIPGMFQKIPGNVPEVSGECSRRFQGMFKKILGNAFNLN